MIITKELIEAILRNNNQINATDLYNDLKETEETYRAVRKLLKTKEEEKKKHEETLLEINKNIIAVQNKCKHLTTTYFADPSGNGDSYYECNVCLKEL